jgi:hypothetical protein
VVAVENERLALAVPLLFGAKVTLKLTDWPAASVFGSVIPETEYSVLLTEADLTVMLAPFAVSVAGKVFLPPTVTVPKFSAVGETASAPELVPVPDSETLIVELPEFHTTVMAPVTEPVAVGLNAVWKVTLCPAASVKGMDIPLTEKGEPLALMREMVRLLVPVLVST